MDKKQFVIKILFAIPTSILAYGVYRLINYLLNVFIVHFQYMFYYLEPSYTPYQVVIGIFSAFLFAWVLCLIHKITNYIMIGYLECCFVVWIPILLIPRLWLLIIKNIQCVEGYDAENWLMLICLLTMGIVSFISKRNREGFPIKWELGKIFLWVIVSYIFYIMIFFFTSLFLEDRGFIIAGLATVLYFCIFHIKTKYRFNGKILLGYLIGLIIWVLLSGIYVLQDLNLDENTYLSREWYVLISHNPFGHFIGEVKEKSQFYFLFGGFVLLGELIAWILHIGRDFEKKIIEKRNAKNKEE